MIMIFLSTTLTTYLPIYLYMDHSLYQYPIIVDFACGGGPYIDPRYHVVSVCVCVRGLALLQRTRWSMPTQNIC